MTTLLLLALFATGSPEKIPVFVKSAATADGFTDPSKSRQDSVKDVSNKVKDSKTLTLASTETEAVIVLEVLGRGTGREVNFWGAQNKSQVAVRLVAGSYTTEFVGESGSKGMLTGYGDAAKKVVQQIEAWAKENHAKLTAPK